MSRSITYSPLPDPGGLTPKEWAREVRILARRGWLQDPALVDWSDDPNDPVNLARREMEAMCLSCCWRGRCRKAGRCLNLINLAIREHRHRLWPDTWKERVAAADPAEICAFTPVDRIGRIPFYPQSFTDSPPRKRRRIGSGRRK